MSSREIVECDICGCKTNKLYLSDNNKINWIYLSEINEILCADCEADYCKEEVL